jgi:hypothetical protein
MWAAIKVAIDEYFKPLPLVSRKYPAYGPSSATPTTPAHSKAYNNDHARRRASHSRRISEKSRPSNPSASSIEMYGMLNSNPGIITS